MRCGRRSETTLGGRHAEAMREVERALQLNAQSFESHLMKGWISEQIGKPDAAFAAYRDAQRFGGAPEDALRSIDAAYRAEGLPGYYRGWLERSGGTGIISETSRARLYIEVGQLDHALESLKRAFDNREGALAWVNVEPTFRPLWSDARFQEIASRVGR